MNSGRRDLAGGTWHASPELLAAYCEGRARPSDSWSVEAHLIGCALCRAELAAALRPADADLLTTVRHDMLTGLPARSPARRRRGMRWLWWVVQPRSLIAVVLAVAGATLLDLVAGGGRPAGDLVWLLAPAIPVAGVAMASFGEDDPCWEAVLAAPSALLRLVLWRTLSVLVLAVPLSTVAGLLPVLSGRPADWSAAWLLPCLALTSAMLAAGAVIGVERAARVLALLWCLGTVGPPLLQAGDVVIGLRLAAEPGAASALLGGVAQQVWAVLILFAGVVVLVARNRYDAATYSRWSH